MSYEIIQTGDNDVVKLLHITSVIYREWKVWRVQCNDGKEIFLYRRGKFLTGFSNTEEEAVQLTDIVPFLVEDGLKKSGGLCSKGPDWGSYVRQDGLLITGQNPASSEQAAKLLLKALQIA